MKSGRPYRKLRRDRLLVALVFFTVVAVSHFGGTLFLLLAAAAVLYTLLGPLPPRGR